VALALVYVVWGSTYLAIKIAERTIPPLFMAAVRFLVAGGLLFAWSALRRPAGAPRPGSREWVAAAVVGVALFLGGNGGVVLSERMIPSGLAALLVATVPIWMVVLGWLFLRERLGGLEAAGLALGFLGLVWLVGLPHGQRIDLGGVLLVVAGSLAWAGGSLYARRAPIAQGLSTAPAMQMLAGGAALLVASAAAGELGRLRVSRISMESVLATIYLVVFGSIVAFTAYAWLIRRARTSLVATYAYVNPVVAVLLGSIVLDERLTATTLFAGLVILVGVALIVRARASRAHGS
jgi:drug/metabolite transporter (DMT)-like permease